MNIEIPESLPVEQVLEFVKWVGDNYRSYPLGWYPKHRYGNGIRQKNVKELLEEWLKVEEDFDQALKDYG